MLQCSLCNKMFEKLTRDHIVPRAFGGSGKRVNLRQACERCNRKRATQMSLTDLMYVATHNPLEMYNKPRGLLSIKHFRHLLRELKNTGGLKCSYEKY